MKRLFFALAALLFSLAATAAPPSTFVGLSLSIPFNDTPSLAVKPLAPSLAISAYTTNAAAPEATSAPIASTSAPASPMKSAAAIPLPNGGGGHGGGHLGGNGNSRGGNHGTVTRLPRPHRPL